MAIFAALIRPRLIMRAQQYPCGTLTCKSKKRSRNNIVDFWRLLSAHVWFSRHSTWKKWLETTSIPSFSVKSAVKLKTIQRKLMLVRRVELWNEAPHSQSSARRAQTFIPYWIFWLVRRISPKISDCSYYNTILNRFNKTTPNVSRITRPRNENIKWNLSVEPKLALTFDTNSKSSFDICSALWLLRVTGFSFLPAVLPLNKMQSVPYEY